MCNEVTLVRVPQWAMWRIEGADFDGPEFGRDAAGVPCFKIDACIAGAVQTLWAAGFRTLGCCCGHGSGRGVISLDLGYWEGDTATEDAKGHHCTVCGVLHG